eukprot:g4157.t1
MWSFIQEAQKTVFDVIAPALGPEGEIETAVLNGDMGGATRIAEQNRLMLSHVRTSYNKNMLHVACSRANNMEMIQYLLSCGVDLRGITDTRETCLHFAARAGCMTTTRFLVENGISVTQKNTSGQTAYDLATNNYNVRQYLLPLQLQQDGGAVPYFATSSVQHAAQQFSEVTEMTNQMTGRSGGRHVNSQASYGHNQPSNYHNSYGGMNTAAPATGHYGNSSAVPRAGGNTASSSGPSSSAPGAVTGSNVQTTSNPTAPANGGINIMQPQKAVSNNLNGAAAGANSGANGNALTPQATLSGGEDAKSEGKKSIGKKAAQKKKLTYAERRKLYNKTGRTPGKKKITDYTDGFGSSAHQASHKLARLR